MKNAQNTSNNNTNIHFFLEKFAEFQIILIFAPKTLVMRSMT